MRARIRGRSKYRNVRCEVDGQMFDSKAEARRWQELRLLEKAGKIDALQRQVRFPLQAKSYDAIIYGESDKVGTYVADFDYWDLEQNQRVTEDVKGMVTELARWKLKHFAAQYGREVQIVRMR